MRLPQDPWKRKNEMLDAAEFLLRERGYEGVTIRALAARLGVATGTIYYYFKSKEEVLDAVLARYTEKSVRETRKVLALPLTGTEKISAIFQNLLAMLTENERMVEGTIYLEAVLPLTMRWLDRTAERMTEELRKLIGPVGSGREIEVDLPEQAIFFLLETMGNLMERQSMRPTPAGWRADLLMAERIVAAILGCKPEEIHLVR